MKYKVGDKVIILDGKKIPNYAGAWSAYGMDKHIGEVREIKSIIMSERSNGYQLAGVPYLFDERGLELVEEPKEKIDRELDTVTVKKGDLLKAFGKMVKEDDSLKGVIRALPFMNMFLTIFLRKMEEQLFGGDE